MATKTKAAPALTLTAYCMKTKTKDVPMLNAVINKKGGKYIASGVDEDDNKMTTILSEEKALACIEAGLAEAGEGIGEEEEKAPAKKAKKK